MMLKSLKLLKPKNGKLIAIEGIDGAGKTTIIDLTKKWLKNKGYKVKVVKEPGDSKWGKKIKESYYKDLSAEEELELFLEDRKYNVENIILPALKEGYIVLMDRYFYSTIAYQGARGINPNYILKRNLEIAPTPDLVIILDCKPEICIERITKRLKEKNISKNRFEKLDFLKKVRHLFLKISNLEISNEIYGNCRVIIIDSNRDVKDVFNDVKFAIEKVIHSESYT